MNESIQDEIDSLEEGIEWNQRRLRDWLFGDEAEALEEETDRMRRRLSYLYNQVEQEA